MDWPFALTLALVAIVMLGLAFTRIPPDLILVGVVLILVLTGILQTKEALSGFANEGMITVGVLYIVAAGLRETGAIELVTDRLLGRPRSMTEAQFRLLFPIAFLSGFINNTPLVAMMLPVVKDWAKRTGLSASKLLLPLSYATILGGMCTLIGTSANLVVNGLVIEQIKSEQARSEDPTRTEAERQGAKDRLARLPNLRLFDQAPVGVPCALVGLGYIVIAGRRLLPDRQPLVTSNEDTRQYTVEMLVEPTSPLVGKSIERAGLRSLPGLYLMEIDRGGEVLAAVSSHERLQGNDRLVFVGVVESVVDLQKMRSLRLATDQVFKIDAPRSERYLVEVVVSDSNPLLGQSIREGRFRSVYNAAIIAVARNGERVRGKIGDIVLQVGDTLLLETHPSFVEQQRNSRDFFLVSPLQPHHRPTPIQAWIALSILVVMIALAGFGVLSMLKAALLAAAGMLVARCCSESVARRAIDWQVLIVIASAFALGQALRVTGVDAWLARGLTLTGDNPWLALAAVYLVTTICTELLSNAAAAALVFPISLATADSLGVHPMPFIMVLMIAASCSFSTPIGYQTNLMVYGPGGYRFSDYLRFGIPLNLTIGTMAVLLTPLVYPF